MIRIQLEDFTVAEEYAALAQQDETGAIVTFVGRVRGQDDSAEIASLTLEHYPGMTEKNLHAISEQAFVRWPLQQVRIIHRVGELQAGEQIVFIGVSSAHRAVAFAACEFLIDKLKTEAMFWKKQTDRQGNSQWLKQKSTDRERSQQWEII